MWKHNSILNYSKPKHYFWWTEGNRANQKMKSGVWGDPQIESRWPPHTQLSLLSNSISMLSILSIPNFHARWRRQFTTPKASQCFFPLLLINFVSTRLTMRIRHQPLLHSILSLNWCMENYDRSTRAFYPLDFTHRPSLLSLSFSRVLTSYTYTLPSFSWHCELNSMKDSLITRELEWKWEQNNEWKWKLTQQPSIRSGASELGEKLLTVRLNSTIICLLELYIVCWWRNGKSQFKRNGKVFQFCVSVAPHSRNCQVSAFVPWRKRKIENSSSLDKWRSDAGNIHLIPS